ncbi:4-amino-4-deoxy-L-arabinose transferase [Bradyrhizobium sp. WSM 1704]|uniref:4-amino-4-deoxy-L-arabinose transferase n=1 Tax=Bradyrhizobium semiaridum TaxID=2821404 RepID=UPI001CE2CA2D|nr:4-amino-4-deoxy-L-arabinose transferase [Bradyrhizobium semiaridum]MCA6126039.1 4-amino-4-deoxy-L-arabinose transferase [Bradyrhizobium semiaridum]
MRTSADPSPGRAGRISLAATRIHPLTLILLLALALALRLPLAFWPNTIHPDEIFQYLEPAWRTLGHDGIVTWEWRYGIRGWFLPTLMAGPVALGDWMAPDGSGAFVVPRLAAALASLSIVISAWLFGARVSRLHAIVAAFVAAIWFEIVMFAPHTLSESLATALIVPAALLLTDRPSRMRLLAGGALLAFAFVCRFQYAPATAVLVVGVCWRDWRNLIPTIAGGIIALLLAAVIDLAHGAVPFGWLVANIEQNLLHDRAAEFGVSPMITYLSSFWITWSVAIVLLIAAIWRGWRHAPLLLAMALTDILFHSLIAHKEYRFIFLSVVLLMILAALGSSDWVQSLRARRAWRPWALPAAAGGWALLSVALAGASEPMRDHWMRGIGAARLAAALRGDPQLCGLALYNVPFHLLPGRERLTGPAPLYAVQPADPLAKQRMPAAVRSASPAFNRILVRADSVAELPPDYSRRDCDAVGNATACIYARAGTCDATPAAVPFAMNDVLGRLNY